MKTTRKTMTIARFAALASTGNGETIRSVGRIHELG